MTIINPNSIAGITSVTAEAGVINFYKSDGTLAGLQLNGVNFNTTSGISTFNNVYVGGTITYEDVKNVDSIGIITARGGLNVTANTDTDTLNVSGISTFGGVLKIPTVAGTNTNSALNVLFQTATGVIDGGSNLTYNPGGDVLSVNGNHISINTFRGQGDLGTLTCSNHSSTTFVKISSKADIGIKDNTAGAFNIKEGSNEYITIDTTNSSELIKFGTAGIERLRILSDGNIRQTKTGANPNFTISRNESITSTDQSIGVLDFASNTAHTVQARLMAKSLGTSNVGGDLVVETRADGGSLDERLRITGSGDLCVGKTSAIGKAEIATSASEIGLTVSNSVHDSQLQILASASNKNSSIFFGDGGDGNIGWIDYDHNDNNLNFRVNGSERLRINSSGQMGLGQATPVSKLHISETGSNTINIQLTNATTGHSAGTDGMTIGYSSNSSTGFINVAEGSSGFSIKTGGTGTAQERLRITGSGKVSIGDAATHTLSAHSEGDDLVIGGAGWRGMTIYGEGGGGVIQFADNADNRVGQIMYSHGDNSMIFRVAGNQTRMLIDASGRVIIGDTDADNAHANADELIIGNNSTNQRSGISIVSATNQDGMIHFSDGTGAGQYVGQLNYHHNDNTFRFYTAGTERLAIDNNGNVYFANDTNTYIGHPTTDTLAVWSAGTERLRIDASGRVIIGGTTHAGGAQLVVMGGNINAYAAVAMGNKTTAPSDGHVFAMFRLSSGSAGTSRGAEIIAKADGAWTAGSSYPTKVEFAVTKKGDTTVSGCMALRQYGITHIYRPQIGAVNTNTSLTPANAGYIGDDLGLGLKAVYYMGWKNSSASSNYSHNMVDTYYSGHWGQHTQVLVWSIMHYYNVGFRMWNVNAGGGITTVSEWGDGAGSLSVSSTKVGTGTHAGQDVWRRSITCTNSGTYTQHLWFCGLIGGGTNGHCGTNLSQSSADSYFSTRGGGIHFNTIGDADMKASPFYSTWH